MMTENFATSKWVVGMTAICLLASITSGVEFAGGTGEANDPYQIATAEQLIGIGSDPNLLDKCFILVNDIDLDPNLPGGRIFDRALVAADPDADTPGFQGTPFAGSFDGAGHTISGLAIRGGERSYIALFGWIARSTGGSGTATGLVKNLYLTDVAISGRHSVAGVVAGNGGRVVSCTVTGTLSGLQYVAGLVAYSEGDVDSCRFSGRITGKMQVGGIVGYNKASITSCSAQGIVQGASSTGGLVGDGSGQSAGHEIRDCHSQADVSGEIAIGGLVGYAGGRIVSSSSSGLVTGTQSVGGLVGRAARGDSLFMCHSTADVTTNGYDIGGLIGWNDGGVVRECFASGDVEGLSSVGGLIGNNGEQDSLIGWDRRGHIESSYARGDVKGNSRVGGLVGYNRRGVIYACYSTGQVVGGTSTGGLIGKHNLKTGAVRLSCWDRQTSGLSSSDAGRGKTTTELMMPSTFIGWGDGIWRIDPGRDYPRLVWEVTPGELITEMPSTYGGGVGTPDDPYQIWTPDQLMVLAYHPEDYDEHFALMADLDLAVIDPNRVAPIGMNLVPFTGVFNGNGHSISNFTYVGENDDYVGLFGCVGPIFSASNDRQGIIRNLHLVNVNLLGNNCTGGIAGSSTGTVAACSVTGTVRGGETVGALVGEQYGIVEESWVRAVVAGAANAGGLVGSNRQVDEYRPGRIQRCYSQGHVWSDSQAGGLAGINYGWIEACYSSTHVDGGGARGGLIGIQDSGGCIVRCYSVGSVGGASPGGGGLVGAGQDRTAFQCYWDNEASGVPSSAAGHGRPTVRMFASETFEGWGISGDWTIEQGQDYPRLVWENAPGNPIREPAYTYGGGSGLPEDPFQLWTAEQLISIADHYEDFDSCFILMADIDLNDVDPERMRPIGIYGMPFTGDFDGNSHTISNLRFERKDEGDIGLFGCVGTLRFEETLCRGDIRDLRLGNVVILAGGAAGGIAGSCYGGSLAGCSVSGRIAGANGVGGLVGYGSRANVLSGYTTGLVDGWAGVGGLVGRLQGGLVAESKSQCSVNGHEQLGGLVGSCQRFQEEGLLTQCAAAGSVRGCRTLGGLVGESTAIVTDCYADVDVGGETYVWTDNTITGGGTILSSQIGGLLGMNMGSVIHSYSISRVTGQREVGGFVGSDGGGEYIGCLWDAQVAGTASGVGNLAAESDGVFSRMTAAMKATSTFAALAWDLAGETVNGDEDIWTICEGVDYPRLQWEGVECEDGF